MMYKVGIVDDTDELLDDYKVRLKREAIELIVAPEGSMGDIKEWIVQEKIKSILIDYQDLPIVSIKTISQSIDLNGKEKTVNAIQKDDYNYVRLQDLRDDKIEIGYEGIPIIKSK